MRTIAEKTEVIQRKTRKDIFSNSANGDITIEEIYTTHSTNNPPNKPNTNGEIKGIIFFIIFFKSSSPFLLNRL